MGDRVRVGILGLGTVGGGVYLTLRDHADRIASRTGFEVAVTRVSTLVWDEADALDVPADLRVEDGAALVADPEVDVIVEVIGGITVAKQFTLAAFENGKSVVTANKALIAHDGPQLAEAAAAANVDYLFEAAVAGGIPILRSLREGLAADHISRIYGIVNGTCNYMLTQMTEEGADFDAVLQDAQAKGFAEADPSLDIGGGDAAHKATILASMVSQWPVPLEDVPVEGITDVSAVDIRAATELGYVIKHLAVIELDGDVVDCRVHPMLVPKHALLAGVRHEFNALWVQGDVVGETLYYGRGAGRFPTASAIVGDVIDAARNVTGNSAQRVPPFVYSRNCTLRPLRDVVGPFYLRFTVVDQPGVLGRLATLLGERGVSINSVVQHGAAADGLVSVVILTHAAREADLRDTLALVDKLPEIKAPTRVLRVMQY